MASIEPQDRRCERSSGSLKLKIFLKKPEVDQEDAETLVTEKPLKTSDALYAVLSEIHRLCVQRDTKRIFAMPVTTDIAPDYFEVISHPMDLGTMLSRLESRNYYSTAPQYFADLRQMCHNAMLYNPPETVYYQKARKLLNFGEKQMTPNGLRKLSLQLLGNSNALTPEELGVCEDSLRQHGHHHQHHRHHHGNRHRHEAQQPSSRQSASKVREDGGSEMEEEGEAEEDTTMVLEEDEEENSNINGEDTRDSFGSTSAPRKRRRRCRRDSSASLSSTTSTAAAPPRKAPRYAPSSPPLLVPEVIDSPLNRVRFGRGDTGDTATIDLGTPEGDTSLTLSPASTVSSSSRLRAARKPPRNLPATTTTPPQSRKKSTTARQTGSKARRSRHPPQSSSSSAAATTPVPSKPEQVAAEDRWNFTGSLTDRRSPAQVLAHNKQAAKLARQRYLDCYGDPGRQRIVYLDTSETGVIYAKDVDAAAEGKGQVVEYPLALRNLLTPQPPSSAGTYHGLVEQMTSQQVASLHALSDLRYDPAEPIAMGIHGPLAIFEKEELEQLCDAYGGDATVMESVLSTLTFVEGLGPTARRWAHLRLAEATRGYHARMLIAFADEEDGGEFAQRNWMKRAGLTIDKSLVEEFKARFKREEEEAAEAAAAEEEPMEASGGSGGQMSMAKLPTNTSTTSATDQQMATSQAPKLDGEEEVEGEEDDDSFDILSAALSASVTPTEQKPTAIQQPPPQQQQQSNQFLLTTCGVPLILEAALPPPPPPQTPLVASVSDIAQISALTAAISPIQQQAIGLQPPLPPPPPSSIPSGEKLAAETPLPCKELSDGDEKSSAPIEAQNSEEKTELEPEIVQGKKESLEDETTNELGSAASADQREKMEFNDITFEEDKEESSPSADQPAEKSTETDVSLAEKMEIVLEQGITCEEGEEEVDDQLIETGITLPVQEEPEKSVEGSTLEKSPEEVVGKTSFARHGVSSADELAETGIALPVQEELEKSVEGSTLEKSPEEAVGQPSLASEELTEQRLSSADQLTVAGIVLPVQEEPEKCTESNISTAEKMEIVHEEGYTFEEANEQESPPSTDQLTEAIVSTEVEASLEEKIEIVHEEGPTLEKSSVETVEQSLLVKEEFSRQMLSSADQLTETEIRLPVQEEPEKSTETNVSLAENKEVVHEKGITFEDGNEEFDEQESPPSADQLTETRIMSPEKSTEVVASLEEKMEIVHEEGPTLGKSFINEKFSRQVLSSAETGIRLSVQEELGKSTEADVSTAENNEVVHEKGITYEEGNEEFDKQESSPSTDELTEREVVLPVQEEHEKPTEADVSTAEKMEIFHEEGITFEEGNEEFDEQESSPSADQKDHEKPTEADVALAEKMEERAFEGSPEEAVEQSSFANEELTRQGLSPLEAVEEKTEGPTFENSPEEFTGQDTSSADQSTVRGIVLSFHEEPEKSTEADVYVEEKMEIVHKSSLANEEYKPVEVETMEVENSVPSETTSALPIPIEPMEVEEFEAIVQSETSEKTSPEESVSEVDLEPSPALGSNQTSVGSTVGSTPSVEIVQETHEPDIAHKSPEFSVVRGSPVVRELQVNEVTSEVETVQEIAEPEKSVEIIQKEEGDTPKCSTETGAIEDVEAPNTVDSKVESSETKEPEILQNPLVVETFESIGAPLIEEDPAEVGTAEMSESSTEGGEMKAPSNESIDESPPADSKLEEGEPVETSPTRSISEMQEPAVGEDRSSLRAEVDVRQSPPISDDEASWPSSEGSAVNFGGLVSYACTESSEDESSCPLEQEEEDLSGNWGDGGAL